MNRAVLQKTLYAAFITTIPVLMGYLAIGIAFGILLYHAGYHFLWAGFMSGVIYAGSMQYVAVSMLASQMGLAEVAVMTLIINMRHMVYGLSMLTKFKNMGRRGQYMIFSLTDETYALLCGAKAPKDADESTFYFFIALLDQVYWVTGSVIGAVAGSFITFNTKGIDFAMTALFLVICVEQWMSFKNHVPALLGTGISVMSLLIFGPQNMLIPSMICMIAGLIFARPYLGKKLYLEKEEEIK